MEQTLEQRCKVALECLPDARYRTMLARLFDELLARAAVPVVQPPEFQEVSWGVDSTMRPCTGTAVSEYAFREWAKANGVALVAPMARQEPKTDSVYPVQPSTEAATARDAAPQRHITDMLVAHRDMIEAQQHGDSAAEVLAVQRMESARSAVAGASPCRPRQTDTGEEQLEPFWCHEQSHDRARCEAQCAECAEDGAPASDPDRFIGGAAGDATYAVAPAEATSNVAVSLRNANPARSQEDGYCAASGVQPLKGKSHE